MIPLNSEQKKLLFDYCLGLTSPEKTAEAEVLISSNKEAAGINFKLKATLAPLDCLEPEPCPDALAERTVWRLTHLANSSQDRLRQLLASEQMCEVGVKRRFWAGFGGRLATAAVFMIIASVVITTLKSVSGYARENYRRQRCQMQLGNIFQGLSNYVSDHDGQPPAVATTAGAPWWKVGDQGSENHSNTRHIYLLVQGGYVKPDDFVCTGIKSDRTVQITPSQIKSYKDFPDRSCVTYSFQIRCRLTENSRLLCRKVIMSDWNPLFEGLPDDFTEPFQVRLNKKLLELNSINHNRRGQNVLFGDGRVEFLRTRYIGTDDIFTLQDTDIYQGCELPSRENDFFLAP